MPSALGNLAAEVDAFAAAVAHDASGLVSRQFFGGEDDLHPLVGEEVAFREFAIGGHLLRVLVLYLRMQRPGSIP